MTSPTAPEPGASGATGPLSAAAPPECATEPVAVPCPAGAEPREAPVLPAGAAPPRPPERLRRRRDFVAASRARRQGAPAFTLQGRDRGDGGPARVGFTCSKRVGNAVARNRARRRLREAARLVLPALARPGWDYVLIGRAESTAARPFPELLADLRRAIDRLHR